MHLKKKNKRESCVVTYLRVVRIASKLILLSSTKLTLLPLLSLEYSVGVCVGVYMCSTNGDEWYIYRKFGVKSPKCPIGSNLIEWCLDLV